MFSYAVMWQTHGDPLFADKVERIAFNALPATFASPRGGDMWAHQYFQAVNEINAIPIPGFHGDPSPVYTYGINQVCSHGALLHTYVLTFIPGKPRSATPRNPLVRPPSLHVCVNVPYVGSFRVALPIFIKAGPSLLEISLRSTRYEYDQIITRRLERHLHA